LIYISCHHCDKYIFLCQHDPSCIKYAEGYCDSEDFMQHGLCRNLANKKYRVLNVLWKKTELSVISLVPGPDVLIRV
jgi:hypothetical protein